MSQSLVDVILHLVFSTKERQRWIDPQIEEELYQYICGVSWQAGYGGFSVSRPLLDGAIRYVSSQKEHHKKVSFKEELIGY